MTEIEQDAFSSNRNMPDTSEKASQFLEWHQLLSHDVEVNIVSQC